MDVSFEILGKTVIIQLSWRAIIKNSSSVGYLLKATFDHCARFACLLGQQRVVIIKQSSRSKVYVVSVRVVGRYHYHLKSPTSVHHHSSRVFQAYSIGSGTKGYACRIIRRFVFIYNVFIYLFLSLSLSCSLICSTTDSRYRRGQWLLHKIHCHQ